MNLKEMKLRAQAEFDARVAKALKDNPAMITADIAKMLCCGYWDISRAYSRLGIVRSNGRPKKVQAN